MKNRILYIKCIIKLAIMRILHCNFSKFMGKKQKSMEESNQLLYDYVNSGKPFALCRFGTAEMGYFAWHEEHKMFGTKRYKRHVVRTEHPTDEDADRWVESVKDACGKADIMAYFKDNPPYEEYIFSIYAKQAEYIRLDYLEPLYAESPWTLALEGKKVLVVSPFYEQIKEQYLIRDKVYQGKTIFPKMELTAIPSVWYVDAESGKLEGFRDWFEALDVLYRRIMQYDFDIALLSCGSLGFNLAVMIKEAGRQAVHFGGALQMMFGVLGSRWENMEKYKPYFNEYWIRASLECAPKTQKEMDALDYGCYW